MRLLGNFLIVLIFSMVEASAQSYVPFSMDYTNDAPYYPKMRKVRIKSGGSTNLNCNKAKNDVVWQFKPCGVNYRGIDCGNDDTELNVNGGQFWKLLKEHTGQKFLEIKNATLEHTGIYKCISKHLVMKAFVVEIDSVSNEWPPPKVISVIPSDYIIHVNSYLTINCSVSSKSPLKILWFKECWMSVCDIDFAAYEIEIGEDSNCLCLINDTSNNSTYNWRNIYISKLHIFNAHIWDGGTYVCSALSSYGKDYKKVFISIEEQRIEHGSMSRKSYLILLFIPLILILLYVLSHVCCTSKKKKRSDSKQLHHLISSNYVISAT